ncbi:ABC transporter permease [Nocardia sp. AG03]|uniref:ABC transporter permease n=1 Tax=Nocardia sp. AG03 TaxID=3025312 RepID=UPI0024188E39|nr:ABC transporter permease [Nocardia sp. AG03]
MSSPVTALGRGIAAEWTRTGGRGFLWSIAVPLTIGLPLLVTFGIAGVAERFAAIPGQLQVTSVGTTNAVYWVITFATGIMTVTAAYAHATRSRGSLGDLDAFLFPRIWVASLARWIFYGTLAAVASLALLVVVLTALPALFPLVYGEVALGDSAGRRFLWTVPIYAFTACGIGIAIGSVIRTPPAAIAVLLFWVYVAEDSISLFPDGYTLQSYAPFLNAVAATGQELAFLPRFGRDGALIYFVVVTVVLFTVAVTSAQWRRRRH